MVPLRGVMLNVFVAVSKKRASAGSVGGSSVDRGVQYQRSVAAYAASFGLAGLPLQGFGPSGALGIPSGVHLEVDSPVDDVRVDFASNVLIYPVQSVAWSRRGVGRGCGSMEEGSARGHS